MLKKINEYRVYQENENCLTIACPAWRDKRTTYLKIGRNAESRRKEELSLLMQPATQVIFSNKPPHAEWQVR